jgi:S1-C subfamily serine protease
MEQKSEFLKMLSGAIEEVAAKASPSILSVGSDRRAGTGVVLGRDGLVLTAGHVVHGLKEVSVGLDDGSKTDATVLGRDPYSDFALLRAEDANLAPIELGGSADAKVGQFVLALANPLANGVSVTSGLVTGVNRRIGGWWHLSLEKAIITDARLNPGYSGGPLLDAEGKMIGMNVAYFSKRGIAVPTETILASKDRIASGKDIRRAYLGIVSGPVSIPEYVVGENKIKQTTGLMVYSVEPGSAARKAGLAMGDVLIGLGGGEVKSMFDLESMLMEDAAGKETKASIIRGERLVELAITPGVRGDS